MKTCSWCAEKLDEETATKKTDAQGYVHFFHQGCWDRHMAVFGERDIKIIVQGICKTSGE